MQLKRRIQLLEWARRSGAYIVEDDYDSDFRYNGSPLTALAGLDNCTNVIYIGTFSKSLGAGLRLGYLVLPKELISAAIDLKGLTDNGTSWLEQAALRDFMESGSFARHLRRIRKVYRERRDTLITELGDKLDDWKLAGHDGGMHVAATLPEGFSAQSIQFKAIDVGVGIYSLVEGPAIDFTRTALRQRALFFGYPCLPTDRIKEAISRLAKIMKSEPH